MKGESFTFQIKKSKKLLQRFGSFGWKFRLLELGKLDKWINVRQLSSLASFVSVSSCWNDTIILQYFGSGHGNQDPPFLCSSTKNILRLSKNIRIGCVTDARLRIWNFCYKYTFIILKFRRSTVYLLEISFERNKVMRNIIIWHVKIIADLLADCHQKGLF